MTWPTATLGELSKGAGQYGVGLSSREWRVGDPRYIRITDIDDDGRLNSSVVAPDGGRSDWEKAILQEGDLLFARSGATVGKTYLHSADSLPAVFAGYLIRFQLDTNRALPNYVFRFTQGAAYRAWVASSQRAVAQPNINAKQYGSLPIPLPPLDQQRRIAAILDRVDTMRAKGRSALHLIEHLRCAAFLAFFGDPVDNPQSWRRVRLGDVISGIASGESPVCESRPAVPGEWGVLKLGAISYGQFKPVENKAFLGNVKALKKVEVKPGDFLFSRKNTKELVGATVVVPADAPSRLLLPDLIFRIDLIGSEIVPEYLQSLLRNSRKRSQLVALASGSASSMSNISQARLCGLTIEVPPIEKQRKFAEYIHGVDRVQGVYQRTLTQLNALFASLQSRAFTGQL